MKKTILILTMISSAFAGEFIKEVNETLHRTGQTADSIAHIVKVDLAKVNYCKDKEKPEIPAAFIGDHYISTKSEDIRLLDITNSGQVYFYFSVNQYEDNEIFSYERDYSDIESKLTQGIRDKNCVSINVIKRRGFTRLKVAYHNRESDIIMSGDRTNSYELKAFKDNRLMKGRLIRGGVVKLLKLPLPATDRLMHRYYTVKHN